MTHLAAILGIGIALIIFLITEIVVYNLIVDLLAAFSASTPFPLAWMRARHIRNGHPFNNSTRLEKLRVEKHPHTDSDFIYTINVRLCNECGLVFNDEGLERRKQIFNGGNHENLA